MHGAKDLPDRERCPGRKSVERLKFLILGIHRESIGDFRNALADNSQRLSYRRFDVLIETEEVGWVVLVFQCDEAIILVRAV